MKAFLIGYPIAILIAGLCVILAQFEYSEGFWPAWVQAVGSILAILASVALFYVQRRAEMQRADDETLEAKAKSANAVQSVAFWAITAMEQALESYETDGLHGVASFRPDRIDQIQAMLSRFIEPSADAVALHTALVMSNLLADAKSDFLNKDPVLRDYFINRGSARLDEARRLYRRLLNHQYGLQGRCRLRGIDL